jgi:GT2 family glycosyltransferase
LVLVDNAHNSIIKDLDLTPFDAEVLSTPEPMGFAEANNYALTHAARLEDIVLFLNQDTVSPAGWIDTCSRALDWNLELGAVSPLIRTYEDDGWDPSFMACLTDEQQADLTANRVSRKVLVSENVPAAALMVRTEVLMQTGPFDPVFGSYYEDYDLCRRIREQKYEIGFCTGAYIRHFSGGSTATAEQRRRRMRQLIRNRVLYHVRGTQKARWQSALRWAVRDFPRRLARGLVGTTSSQPPLITLKAYGDLMQLGPRILSRSHDRALWQQYLDEIGWPPPRQSVANQQAVNQQVEAS